MSELGVRKWDELPVWWGLEDIFNPNRAGNSPASFQMPMINIHIFWIGDCSELHCDIAVRFSEWI